MVIYNHKRKRKVLRKGDLTMTNEQRTQAIKNIIEACTEAMKNANTEEEKMNIVVAQNMQIAMLLK